jgi:membrane associated rhomboid family serine protease
MRVHVPGCDPLTILTGVLFLVFLVISRAGGVQEFPWPFVHLGLSWTGLSQGEIWQLGSHALIHGNWLHLWLNLIMLWLVGGRVAHIVGWRKWLGIVSLGVFVGGLLHGVTGAMVVSSGNEEPYLVGVSGACFALLVALITLSPESRMWPVPVSGKNLGFGIVTAELLLWLMQPELGLPGFSQMGGVMVDLGGGGLFGISHACHFGGAVTGWWCARQLLAPPPTLEDLKRDRAERESQLGICDHDVNDSR